MQLIPGMLQYIEVYFTFGLLDYVCFNKDFIISRFVIWRFCSIHFTVILAGLKKIICYTKVNNNRGNSDLPLFAT